MKQSQNQNSPNVQKDDVKRKSPTFFIQLGLVFALLVVYFAIEAKTYVKDDLVVNEPGFYEPYDEFPPEIIQKEYEPQLAQPEPEPDLSTLKVIDDTSDHVESSVKSNEMDPSDKIDINKRIAGIIEVRDIEPPTEDFSKVEVVPMFPGCSGTNEELRNCFSEKISQFVNKNFDVSVSEGLNLQGRQRISVQFIVDQAGNIADVKVRGPHKRLENEAKRVVELLPHMTPGKQQNNTVKVKYTLPIVFQIQE